MAHMWVTSYARSVCGSIVNKKWNVCCFTVAKKSQHTAETEKYFKHITRLLHSSASRARFSFRHTNQHFVVSCCCISRCFFSLLKFLSVAVVWQAKNTHCTEWDKSHWISYKSRLWFDRDSIFHYLKTCYIARIYNN